MANCTARTEDKPYIPFPVDGIPETRTNCLSILAQLDDDVSLLSPEQLAAFRKLYRLDDDRTVEQLIRDGEIVP